MADPMLNERRRSELLKELEALNVEVTAVLAKRKAWMDGHMADFAKVKVGEDIYNMDTGAKLGTVSELYRYWDSQQNPLYDVTMDVNYQFHTGANCYDNTSRHRGCLRIGTRADVEAEQKRRSKSVWEHDHWPLIFGSKDV